MRRWSAAGACGPALAVALIALAAPASASAAITSVLSGQTISGNPIACSTQADGVRVCQGTDGGATTLTDTRLKSFDGVPLALYVILPPAPASGTDGHYPLVVQSHGWGSQATGPNNTEYFGPTGDAWAKDGYAVVELTARGWGDSCGSAQSRLVSPTACQKGYLRLDDDRYEVRDIQNAAGLLVDEGVVDPNRIGVTGESYGGGVSLQLATLKDRVMNADGSFSPWRSPGGTPLHVAAAAPVIPWSDLVNSLLPNGRTLDFQVTSPTADLSPIGVSKQSFVAGLYALGLESGFYSAPGTDSSADLTTWNTLINAGEPYDTNPQDQATVNQIQRFHSAYYLLDGASGDAREAPSPLLIANGFTDDLFPVDEGVRYYNLDRSLYPTDPVGLDDFDFGHMRGQNKPADVAGLSARIQEFFDHYVKGTGAQPPLGATALTQTCPKTATSGGPFSAPTWAALHPGEVDFSSAPAHTILSSAGNPTIAQRVDPITGGGACATVSSTDQGAGVATYRLPAVTGGGYTLLGAATVTADLNVTGTFAYVAERLWDVDPATGTQTLVARGLYRINSTSPNGVQLFQLHPGAWHFAPGHIPKLELLGQDPPYARTSNGTFSISVSALHLQLPVHDTPGAPGTSSAVVKFHTPGLPSTARCNTRPASRIAKRRAHASRHGLVLSGTASATRCAHASSAIKRKEGVAHVFVIVYRPASRGRCSFLNSKGRLTRPRACQRTIEFRARGTSHWSLRLRMPIPSGRYFVRIDAVDGFHHHQRHSGVSVLKLRVR
jgi:dienelactone hydrolase